MNEKRFKIIMNLLNTVPGLRGVNLQMEDHPKGGWNLAAERGFEFHLREPTSEDTFDTWYSECLRLVSEYRQHLWKIIQEAEI